MPALLRAWLAVVAVSTMARFVEVFGYNNDPLSMSPRWELAIWAAHLASSALLAGGLFAASRGLVGRARGGARVAAASALVGIAIAFAWRWVYAVKEPGPWMTTAAKVQQVVSIAIACGVIGGLTFASWPRRALSITGLACAVVGETAALLLGKLVGWLSLGWNGYTIASTLTGFLVTVGYVLFVLGLARPDPTAEPARAVRGLKGAAAALQLRVVASIVGTGLALLVAATQRDMTDGGAARLLLIAGAAINLVAQILLVRATCEAASAGVDDLPSPPLAIASALAAWAGAVMALQLPLLYAALYGESGRLEREWAETLAVAAPLAVTASIVLVGVAITRFAARRGLEELRSEAASKCVVFVLLMLGAVGITAWLVPEARTESGLLAMMIIAAVAGLAAQLIMARLCATAAEVVDREPSLPVATLVEPRAGS